MRYTCWKTYSMFLCVFVLALSSLAQDIHFSQFYRSPLQLNPALTGSFDGAYRFSGNFRQQWASISEPFTTLAIGADAANVLRIKNLGAGLQLSNDRAGDGALRITQINPSFSWAFKLAKDSTQHIIIGAQPSIQIRQIDANKLSFGNQYNGVKFDPTINNGEAINGSSSLFTMHSGITYRKYKNRREHFTVGMALHNLFSTESSFLDDSESLQRRFTTHVEWRLPFHPDMDITPGWLFLSQGEDSETLIGANLTYILDHRSYNFRSVQLGVWNRFKDAVVFFGGMEWDQLQVGISYDVNTSSLKEASNNRGGWEISAIYIIKHRLPKRKHFKKCPDFI